MNLTELDGKNKQELLTLASELGLENGLSALPRNEIVFRMMQSHAEQQGYILASGILDLINDGYGFLRQPNLKPSPNDVYVSQSQIRRFALRTGRPGDGAGEAPQGQREVLRPGAGGGRKRIDADVARNRPAFENLTPIFPDVQLKLETTRDNLSTRLMDLLSPVGRGQRGLIVSPPKAGKTTLLKHIAQGITINSPGVSLMVALIGERPEEVTEMKRSIEGEVFSSTFDDPVEDHCRVAELALERDKTACGVREGRHNPAGQHYASHQGLQPVAAQQWEDSLRWD